MSKKLIRIKERILKGTFEGWFKDYEGTVHNPDPNRSKLWIEKEI